MGTKKKNKRVSLENSQSNAGQRSTTKYPGYTQYPESEDPIPVHRYVVGNPQGNHTSKRQTLTKPINYSLIVKVPSINSKIAEFKCKKANGAKYRGVGGKLVGTSLKFHISTHSFQLENFRPRNSNC